MADPHVIALRKPVGPKGREISELRLREPTAGEVLKASRETGRGLALSLLTQVAGVDAAVIEALPGRVCDRALEHLMTFIDPILNEKPEDAPDEELDELTIDLAETIQIGTTWLSKLELREPTLGELIKADKYDGIQRTVVLVALGFRPATGGDRTRADLGFRQGEGVRAGFYRGRPSDWRRIVGRLTRFFGWSPADALGLSLSDLALWAEIAAGSEK